MDDRLGVAGRPECVAGTLELPAQLLVVVDLAVEDDADRAIFVEHRLLPAGQIDDAEAAHAERHAIRDVDALFIGPAMHHHPAHRANVLLDAGTPVPPNDSCDTTHKLVVRRWSLVVRRRSLVVGKFSRWSRTNDQQPRTNN